MREIQLTRGLAAIVDALDYEFVSQWSWYATPGLNTWYAERRGPRRADGSRETIAMHRLVLGLREGDPGIVDHINRDGLDNRRSNLRITDKSGNALNSDRARTPRRCETCEQLYLPSRPTTRFCSLSCSRRRPDHPRSQRRLPEVDCPTCGVTFHPHNHSTKFCSRSCANRGRSRKIGLR